MSSGTLWSPVSDSWCLLCPDVRGFVVLQESPRGGEDDAVRHGPGLIQDARRHRLSGPKHQVRNNNKLLWITHRVDDDQLNRDFLFFRVYNTETGKLKKCLKGSSGDEGALLKVTTALRTCFICHLLAVLSLKCYCPLVILGELFCDVIGWYLVPSSGPHGSLGVVLRHQLLRQKHHHLWLRVRRVCRHPVRTLRWENPIICVCFKGSRWDERVSF